MEFSINHYYSKQHSRCGYCKGTKCSVSHGMHAYTMFPQDYQELIDRGWRRSGLYCYKPLNKETCCPCYTIKCDALEFRLNKSHKKILKRMTRFLRDGKKDKSEETAGAGSSKEDLGEKSDDIEECGGEMGSETVGGIRDEPQEPNLPISDVDLAVVAATNPGQHETARQENEHFDATSTPPLQNADDNNGESLEKCNSPNGCKKDFDAPNPPRKKAKTMRLERRQAKLAAKGITDAEDKNGAASKQRNNQEKTLSDYFADASSDDKHKLEVILIPPNKKRVTDEAFKLYKKYQLLVHNDDPNRLTPSSLKRFCYKSPVKVNQMILIYSQLKLVHVKSEEFKASLKSTYALYQKYQTRIHNDPPTQISEYLEFLQQSPLKYTKTRDGPTAGYGSFHQQYWLDDKLIAVAVIDILPHCVSSVYFFYDPDYSFLSLGTYGSLREIELVQQLARKVPALKYYYMGFYIHSCPKMRYKGRLAPSYLLCPEAYTWHFLSDEIRAKLDQHKYQRFNYNENAKDAEDFQQSDLNDVVLLYDNTYLTYHQYIQSFKIPSIDNMLDVIRSRIYKKITGDDDDRDLILEYGKLVGKSLARRMLYVKT